MWTEMESIHECLDRVEISQEHLSKCERHTSKHEKARRWNLEEEYSTTEEEDESEVEFRRLPRRYHRVDDAT